MRQEDHCEFEAMLAYIANRVSKTKQNTETKHRINLFLIKIPNQNIIEFLGL